MLESFFFTQWVSLLYKMEISTLLILSVKMVFIRFFSLTRSRSSVEAGVYDLRMTGKVFGFLA